MKVLIVGGGGREHALAWKASQSTTVNTVYVAPGNAGTALERGIENINISATDIPTLLSFAQQQHVDLTIVGPEAPLVLGIVDHFQQAGLKIFGPTQAAAQLEGSKSFSKDFLQRHNIPTAEYATFTDSNEAKAYIQTQSLPIVIKADGLAAGKGVIIAQSEAEAITAIDDMLAGNKFGDAGHRIVIEEFLHGEEASFIVMADGQHVLTMASSQDHKARDNGDLGPNTGGMGAYSPAAVVTTKIHAKIMHSIIQPTIQGMQKEGTPYTGFLYAGVMIDPLGTPKVLEFNCRFGDPETQPIMMRMESDLVAHCIAAVNGKLDQETAHWSAQYALGIVQAADGYPNNYRTGDRITGLDKTESPHSKVFHAGTRIEDAHIVTNGGRVLCTVALGNSITEAQSKAYQTASQIHWDGIYYRTDIGYRAIAREKAD